MRSLLRRRPSISPDVGGLALTESAARILTWIIHEQSDERSSRRRSADERVAAALERFRVLTTDAVQRIGSPAGGAQLSLAEATRAVDRPDVFAEVQRMLVAQTGPRPSSRSVHRHG